MNIRQETEMYEKNYLSPLATLSMNSKGREREEEKCILRTDFSRDRDRIIHSKAFRRLKHKTQVFIALDNDHYRTRLTHTLEVSQIARTITRALRLNEDLTEAISLGHDLGHTPFGHSGERALDELSPDGFKHYEQSLRVVDILEKDGQGLNLTWEVRNGIVSHTGDHIAETPEGVIVKYADRFAYINHDIDDAIRAGIISRDDIPHVFVDILGDTQSKRIDTLITDMVACSLKEGRVTMSDEVNKCMMELRDFMFDNVYKKLVEKEIQAHLIIGQLYEYFMKYPEKMPSECRVNLDLYPRHTVVCDYIAGMTDVYCVNYFKKLFIPI